LLYNSAQLADLEAIREAAMRYTHGLDRLDGEWMRSAYWPDATDNHGDFVGNAWEFVDKMMVSAARFRSTMHCVYTHQIELDPDGETARGEVYNASYVFGQDSPDVSVWFGRYLDQYQRRGDEWRILNRVCVHEASGTYPGLPGATPAEKFRPGHFDRPSSMRPIGP
jgi:hypothetical protein